MRDLQRYNYDDCELLVISLIVHPIDKTHIDVVHVALSHATNHTQEQNTVVSYRNLPQLTEPMTRGQSATELQRSRDSTLNVSSTAHFNLHVTADRISCVVLRRQSLLMQYGRQAYAKLTDRVTVTLPTTAIQPTMYETSEAMLGGDRR